MHLTPNIRSSSEQTRSCFTIFLFLVLHEENEWGISLVDEDQPDVQENTSAEITTGVRLAYERRVTRTSDAPLMEEEQSEQSLEDLMNQMKQL